MSQTIILAVADLSRLGERLLSVTITYSLTFTKLIASYPKLRTFVSQVIPSIHEHLCGVNPQNEILFCIFRWRAGPVRERHMRK